MKKFSLVVLVICVLGGASANASETTFIYQCEVTHAPHHSIPLADAPQFKVKASVKIVRVGGGGMSAVNSYSLVSSNDSIDESVKVYPLQLVSQTGSIKAFRTKEKSNISVIINSSNLTAEVKVDKLMEAECIRD